MGSMMMILGASKLSHSRIHKIILIGLFVLNVLCLDLRSLLEMWLDLTNLGLHPRHFLLVRHDEWHSLLRAKHLDLRLRWLVMDNIGMHVLRVELHLAIVLGIKLTLPPFFRRLDRKCRQLRRLTIRRKDWLSRRLLVRILFAVIL